MCGWSFYGVLLVKFLYVNLFNSCFCKETRTVEQTTHTTIPTYDHIVWQPT